MEVAKSASSHETEMSARELRAPMAIARAILQVSVHVIKAKEELQLTFMYTNFKE